ncbi:hypothetical protein PHISP_04903 [Aspergillus sp. HF37]|nr:hypothetical protein PHISP_04903 [Aspergillus sp. HF37]
MGHSFSPFKGRWDRFADDFEVTLQFLLQQAAWLYDRQLSQVRAQMRKVGTTPSNSPSPAPPSVSGSAALGGPPARGAPSTDPAFADILKHLVPLVGCRHIKKRIHNEFEFDGESDERFTSSISQRDPNRGN